MSGAAPSIVYYGGFKLPDEKARGVHAILSCVSMAEAGMPVTLLVRGMHGASDREDARDLAARALAPYDLAVPDGLTVIDAGRSPVGRRFGASVGLRWETFQALRRGPRGRTVFYTMDFPGLRVLPRTLRWRRVLGFRAVFELHNLTSTVLREEAERRVDEANRAHQLERRAADAERVERRCYPRLDGAVTNSRGTLDALRDAFGAPAHALALPNGVDLDRFRDAPACADLAPVDVTYTGSLDGWKGVETLIDAMRELPGARLRLVGFGDDRVRAGIAERLASAAIGDRVEVLGYRPHREIPGILARTRVVVVTTSANSREGREFTCPMKLLEAMAAGLPIVASDLPSIRELVTDDEEALLFAADDASDLAETIRRLLKDSALAKRLGTAAQHRAARYTWSSRAETLRTFLAGVCEGALAG